jgi:hypothetical protein
MKNTEILRRVNALLNRNVRLEQATLDNGTVIEFDSLSAGSPIFAINGENKDPLEVGTYTLADGTIIEVAEIGAIAEVKMPEAETEEVEAGYDKKKEKMEEMPATIEEIVTAVVDAIQPTLDEMQLKIDALGGATTEMKATLSTEKARKPLTHKPAQKVELKSNSLDPQSIIFAKLANLNN